MVEIKSWLHAKGRGAYSLGWHKGDTSDHLHHHQNGFASNQNHTHRWSWIYNQNWLCMFLSRIPPHHISCLHTQNALYKTHTCIFVSEISLNHCVLKDVYQYLSGKTFFNVRIRIRIKVKTSKLWQIIPKSTRNISIKLPSPPSQSIYLFDWKYLKWETELETSHLPWHSKVAEAEAKP